MEINFLTAYTSGYMVHLRQLLFPKVRYVVLVECPAENKETVSNKLKDKMNIYMKWTKKKGIKKGENKEELFANNELHPVSSSKNFHTLATVTRLQMMDWLYLKKLVKNLMKN